MSNQPHLPPSGTLADRHFRLLVAGIKDYAIYMLSPEGFVNSWNAGAELFKGYRPEEIIGQHFSQFYTPEDRDAQLPAQSLRAAFENGRFESEGWRVRKDGTRFWANVVIDPIWDEHGAFIGFAKITRDVGERKAAQEALRESEQQFRLLVRGVTDYALYMLSPLGIVSNWNMGAERIKGYSASEVIGTHFSRFYTQEDRNRSLPDHALAIAAETGRFESEGWRVRKNGTNFWAHVVIDAIHDDDNNLIGFAKITRDITERKLAAEALEQANFALFQAQKMDAIGQLTGGIAHDFNNLLGVLSGGLDVLSLGTRTHGETRIMESMRRATQRGSSLTQQLLSFARQQPLKVELTDINKLINSFEPILRRVADSTVAIEIALLAKDAIIAIDAARFEAAILNLVINARDAMPSGGQISISTRTTDLAEKEVANLPAGSYVRVLIADTGVGIPEELIGRIFEPFFTTKDVGKGTGLGLSQVYGFIAQSGGEVTVHSQLGEGTVFKLYIPLQAASEAAAPALSTTKILLVEDEPDVLLVSAELLRSLGYEVLTASNSKEALAALERNDDIAMLFTDIILPDGMNGIALAQYTREKYPEVKVLLASGYALPVLKETHTNIHEFAFLNKPYELGQLIQHLPPLEGQKEKNTA